jgi:hypothetical protein
MRRVDTLMLCPSETLDPLQFAPASTYSGVLLPVALFR